jgi:hypothetical protein
VPNPKFPPNNQPLEKLKKNGKTKTQKSRISVTDILY